MVVPPSHFLLLLLGFCQVGHAGIFDLSSDLFRDLDLATSADAESSEQAKEVKVRIPSGTLTTPTPK